MRVEIFIFLIAALVIANIYYEGLLIRKMIQWKKYFQMLGVAFAFFVLYYLIKKNPLAAQQIITNSNEYVKYLPVDRQTANMLSPILNFSQKSNWGAGSGTYIGGGPHPIIEVPTMRKSGGGAGSIHKRSVSETKKKFVSAQQGWKCHYCKQQLSAFYEVDHVVPLYKGGTNDITNLVSLCRECHSRKTAMDRMMHEDGGASGGL